MRAQDLHIAYFFFFSSRRRHTRSDRDWSSDVCSSDLEDAERFRLVQRFRRDHPIDETEALGILGAEQFAGEEQALSTRGADAANHERRDHRRRDAEPRLGEGEGDAGYGHGDVARRDDAERSGHRWSMNA